jgi:hypothetical protein
MHMIFRHCRKVGVYGGVAGILNVKEGLNTGSVQRVSCYELESFHLNSDPSPQLLR